MRKTFMIITLAALGALPFFARAQSTEKSRSEVRIAFDECRESLGLEKPEPGQRPVAPSEEERAQMDVCLAGKGIKISELHGPHPHDRHPQSDFTATHPLGGQ